MMRTHEDFLFETDFEIYNAAFLSHSSKEQSATLSSNLNALEKSQGDLENKLGSIQDQHQQDASRLKVELAQAETRTKSLQKEVLMLFAGN